MRVELPDGTVLDDVPEGTSKAQLREKLKANGYDVSKLDGGEGVGTPAAGEPRSQGSSSTLANLAGGALKGAAQIGATILSPIDAAARAMGIENEWVGRNDRRAATTGALEQLGADPESLAFKGAQLGTEVAGTAGAGGVLGKVLTRALGHIPAVRTASHLLETGGFPRTGTANIGSRVAAGATSGATQAGIVNPDDALTGAAFGGALPVVAPAASMLTRTLGRTAAYPAGLVTGAGPTAIKQAGQVGSEAALHANTARSVQEAVAAGRITPQQGQALLDEAAAATGHQADFMSNLRGQGNAAAVVEQARAGVRNMRQKMHDAYATSKGGWASDTTPLDFKPIGQAFNDAAAKFSFKGVPQPGVEQVMGQTRAAMEDWLSRNRSDPAFLTVEGLDALKRHLGTIVPTELDNRAGRAFMSEVIDGVKSAIVKQRPDYAAAMHKYWADSSQLDEIERTLSLGDRATVDTALRKLQSLMNTNYGRRAELGEVLAKEGADIRPALAGQTLSSWTPRGLQSAVMGGSAIGGTINPALLLTLPFQSPRLMGELANVAGRGEVDASRALVSEPGRAALIAALRGKQEE